MARRREKGWQGYDSERSDDVQKEKSSELDPGAFGAICHHRLMFPGPGFAYQC